MKRFCCSRIRWASLHPLHLLTLLLHAPTYQSSLAGQYLRGRKKITSLLAENYCWNSTNSSPLSLLCSGWWRLWETLCSIDFCTFSSGFSLVSSVNAPIFSSNLQFPTVFSSKAPTSPLTLPLSSSSSSSFECFSWMLFFKCKAYPNLLHLYHFFIILMQPPERLEHHKLFVLCFFLLSLKFYCWGIFSWNRRPIFPQHPYMMLFNFQGQFGTHFLKGLAGHSHFCVFSSLSLEFFQGFLLLKNFSYFPMQNYPSEFERFHLPQKTHPCSSFCLILPNLASRPTWNCTFEWVMEYASRSFYCWGGSSQGK